jgi:cation-transporting ATPase 13A3/4/5
MSVIVRSSQNDEMILYCKGAPELIASLAKPEAVPPDFQVTLALTHDD